MAPSVRTALLMLRSDYLKKCFDWITDSVPNDDGTSKYVRNL